jgi:hypothetical protein
MIQIQIILAVIETAAYLETDFSTSIFMDQNPNSQMRVNFNITMHDLSCDFATVDLVHTKKHTHTHLPKSHVTTLQYHAHQCVLYFKC